MNSQVQADVHAT